MIVTQLYSRIRSSTSKPLISGRRRSRRTRSGSARRTHTMPSSPVWARITSCPARSKYVPSADVIACSSSMISTLAIAVAVSGLRAAPRSEEDRCEVVEKEGFAHGRTPGRLEKAARRFTLRVAGEKHDPLSHRRRAVVELGVQHVAGHVGHAEVEENGVVASLGDEGERLLAAADGVDHVAVRAKKLCDRAADRRLVVDDEHALRVTRGER